MAERLTPAEIVGIKGQLLVGQTIVEIDATTRVPTGNVFISGAAGTAPTPMGGTAQAAVSSAPSSLTGTGAIALTYALHAGKNLHAEPGQTSLTIATANWATDGELSIINHTGANLPVVLGAGVNGFVNRADGDDVVGPATLIVLAYLERATIQMKGAGAFCNVAVVGGSGSFERAWATGVSYEAGEIVRATVASGAIGIGDRIACQTTHVAAASFATDVAKWTELPEDADAVTLSGAQAISGVKTFSALPELSVAATTNNQPIRKVEHDAAMALKANLASPTFTGTATLDGTAKLGNGQNAVAPAPTVADATNVYAPIDSTASTTITTSDIAIRLSRAGTSGSKWNNTLDVVMGSHTAGLNSASQVDFRLNNGATALPDMTALTLKGNGDVLANGSQVVRQADVNNTLTSTSTVQPLSAAQGKALKDTADILSTTVGGKALAVHTHVKADVGLGNVDNTSDASKPVSNSMQTALNNKYDSTQAVIDLSGKADNVHTHAQSSVTDLVTDLAGKQTALVSGTNIKTLNGQSVLGAGNIAVGASSAALATNDGGTGGVITQVGNDQVHTFNASGTFVVPTGVTAVQVLVVGGGGASNPGQSGVAYPSGGGGGFVVKRTAFAVTPGASVAVNIGPAVSNSTVNNGIGPAGAACSFGALSAAGGLPGQVSGGNFQGGASGKDIDGVVTNYTGGIRSGESAGGGASSGGNGSGMNAGTALLDSITGTAVSYGGGGAAGPSGTSAAGAAGRGGSNVAQPTAGIVVVRYLYQTLSTPIYANNAAAIAGGLTLGQLYRTGADPDVLCVVH